MSIAMEDIPTVAVDRIFSRLAGTYMAAWERLVGATPITDIKTIWANELQTYLQSKPGLDRIAWALSNLPERAPNVIEFKRLCQQAPSQHEPMLPAPAIDQARVAAELLKLGALRGNVAEKMPPGRLDWARRLRAKDEMDPKSVTVTVRQMYQSVLRRDFDVVVA